MKKIITLAAVAAAMLSLSSCEIIDVLSRKAIFSYPSSEAYNGQSMVLKRASLASYDWSAEKYATIKVYRKDATIAESIDSVAIATFDITSSLKEKENVIIKAANSLYPDNDEYKYSQPCTVYKWYLKLYEVVEGQEVAFDKINGIQSGHTYILRMYNYELEKNVERIVYNIPLSKEKKAEEALAFDFTKAAEKIEYTLIAPSNDYNYNDKVATMFTVGTVHSTEPFEFKATLGEVTVEESFNAVQ